MEEGGGKSGDKGVARVKLSARIVCEMELPSRFFSSGTRNCSSQKANLIRFPCIRPITRPTPERQRIGNLWRYILFSVPPPLISPTEERDRRREITMDRVIVRMILRKFFFFSFEIARIFTIQEELARFGIIYGILGNISGEFDGK